MGFFSDIFGSFAGTSERHAINDKIKALNSNTYAVDLATGTDMTAINQAWSSSSGQHGASCNCSHCAKINSKHYQNMLGQRNVLGQQNMQGQQSMLGNPLGLGNAFNQMANSYQAPAPVKMMSLPGDAAVVDVILGERPRDYYYTCAYFNSMEQLESNDGIYNQVLMLKAAVSGEEVNKNVRIPGVGSARNLPEGGIYFRIYV